MILFFQLELFAQNIREQIMNIYEKQTAAKKEEVLWNRIKNTEYKELPEWNGFEIIPLLTRIAIPIKFIIRKYMKVTIELESDYFPERRDKVIHTVSLPGGKEEIRIESRDLS
jgi:hypothetical protein